MKKPIGDDEFCDVFDVFEWSAPYYSTPQEIITALCAIDYKSKVIKSVNIIGCVNYDGETNVLYRRYYVLFRSVKKIIQVEVAVPCRNISLLRTQSHFYILKITPDKI